MNRHVGEKSLPQADPYIDNNLIIPLRRLDRVIVSWERRGMELDWLGRLFGELIEKYDHRNPYYLPIDSDNRDNYLNKINEGMGTNFETDWPVIASDKGSSNSEYNDIINKEYANILINEYEWFFNRFYAHIN